MHFIHYSCVFIIFFQYEFIWVCIFYLLFWEYCFSSFCVWHVSCLFCVLNSTSYLGMYRIMFWERFWVSCIKNIKQSLNIIQKKDYLREFIKDNINKFIVEIWYQYCYCVDSTKCRLLSNTFFKERNNMVSGKALRVTINFYKKTVSSSYHTSEKTFIEASCINKIHTAEIGFCNCYFWRFVSPFFSERVKKS